MLNRVWAVILKTPGAACFSIYLIVLSAFLAGYGVWQYALAYGLAAVGLIALAYARCHLKPSNGLCAVYIVAISAVLIGFVLKHVLEGAYGQTPIYIGLLAFFWGCVLRAPLPSRLLRLESFYMGIGMLLCYSTSGVAFNEGHVPRYDLFLYQTEASLFGITVNEWSQQFVRPWLSEMLSFFYMFFQVWLDVQLLRYFVWQQYLLARFYVGMFVTYGLGFLGYVILPAQGAFKAFPEKFTTPITGGWFTATNHELVLQFATGIDVFPSLHVGVSVYMFGFLWRYQRTLAKWLIVPVIAIFCSTLYLRYHYLIDVLCGVLLASFALWVEYCYTKRFES